MRPTPVIVTALLTISHVIGHAESAPQDTGQSAVRIEEVRPQENRPAGQDVDMIITNKKMRADTGSKSKYSISTGFGYSGGSLRTPFNEHRPNINNGTGTTDFASLGASVSGKLAFTSRTAAFAGIGLRMITPLEGPRKPESYNGNKLDTDNPSISLQHLYRWYNIQSALSVSQTIFTVSDLTRKGYLTSFGLNQNNVYDIGHTGFTVGLNVYVGGAIFYKRDSQYTADQSDYGMAIAPALEYRLTDRASLHFDTNLIGYDHLRSTPNGLTFRRQGSLQNLGLGYAIARDFYISPSVAFVYNDLRWDRTTWGVGASINWF